jgi:acyl-CoA synthetase (AMP-forming)/AMP-acid ligase II
MPEKSILLMSTAAKEPMSDDPPHSGETLLDLFARRDDHPALIDPIAGTTMTHAQLHQQIDSVAEQLAGLGVSAGDRVALSTANGSDLIVTALAIVAIGAAVAPINPALTTAEIRNEIDDLRCSLMLHGAPAAAAALDAAQVAGIAAHALSISDGDVVIAGAPRRPVQRSSDPRSIALLLHTSGTTSKPKTVPLSQSNLAYSARTIVATYALDRDDISYCVMPLFHIHGLVAATLAALAAGGTVVVPAKFSATTFWDDVITSGATWYTAVPTIHHVVLATTQDGRQRGHRLRFVRSCSSTLPPPLWRRFEAAVGVPLVEAYGMTEASHQMTANLLPPAERRPGSVGVPTGVEVAVLDDAWEPVPAGGSGEVCVRGRSVVDGYLNNREANAASFRDGWFRTGDVGTLTPDGYLSLVGRIKELINRGGEKISPYEVEAVLLEHPAVSEAAAYPVPDEKYGEQVGAVVVATDEVTSEDLITFCRERMVTFKVPSRLAILAEIPKGPTGKVQRRLLASLVEP